MRGKLGDKFIEAVFEKLFGGVPKPSTAQVQWVKDNARFLCEEIYENVSPNKVVCDATQVASALLMHRKVHDRDCDNPDCKVDKILRLFPTQ